MEEIIKKCNSYDQQVGCYNTFDGKCNKENCQIYNLLQEKSTIEYMLHLAEKENKELKEENCNKCDFQKQYFDETKRLMNINRNLRLENEKLKQALEEIRGIAEVRFVDGLNEEADIYNQDMDRIRNKINEVLESEEE